MLDARKPQISKIRVLYSCPSGKSLFRHEAAKFWNSIESEREGFAVSRFVILQPADRALSALTKSIICRPGLDTPAHTKLKLQSEATKAPFFLPHPSDMNASQVNTHDSATFPLRLSC